MGFLFHPVKSSFSTITEVSKLQVQDVNVRPGNFTANDIEKDPEEKQECKNTTLETWKRL